MSDKTQDTERALQKIAAALKEPRGDQPVIDINYELEYIDFKGKLGKGSLAFAYKDTGYVVAAVYSGVDELAEDECRIWFSPIEDLNDL